MLKTSIIVLSVLVLTFVGSTALFSWQAQGPRTGTERLLRQENNDDARRVPDITRWPITDYVEAIQSDAKKRAQREMRGKRYDHSSWRVSPEDPADSTVRVDFLNPSLPAIPVKESSLVVTGQVVDSRAHLSNDKSGIYSEFTVRIEEVLRNCEGESLKIGADIELQREGGRVRFESGRTHWYGISDAGMPVPASRYVFFLKGQDTGVFDIITAYELTGDTIQPLDNLPNSRAYRNSEQSTFLKDVRLQTRCEAK